MVAFTNLVSTAATTLLLAASHHHALAAQLTKVNYPNNATSKAEMYASFPALLPCSCPYISVLADA